MSSPAIRLAQTTPAAPVAPGEFGQQMARLTSKLSFITDMLGELPSEDRLRVAKATMNKAVNSMAEGKSNQWLPTAVELMIRLLPDDLTGRPRTIAESIKRAVANTAPEAEILDLWKMMQEVI